MPNGVLFEGTAGWIFVSRGSLESSEPALLQEPLERRSWTPYVSDDHMGNFFDCIRSRRQPICDVKTGHRGVSICHLGAIALRLGRPVRWDPQAERFVGDREANRLRSREHRRGFDYGMI